jgi:hypothetical protein
MARLGLLAALNFPSLLALHTTAHIITFGAAPQPAASAPNYQMCLRGDPGIVHGWPFCNHTLPVAQRVEDLIGRMALEEKVGMMGADAIARGVPRCCAHGAHTLLVCL